MPGTFDDILCGSKGTVLFPVSDDRQGLGLPYTCESSKLGYISGVQIDLLLCTGIFSGSFLSGSVVRVISG